MDDAATPACTNSPYCVPPVTLASLDFDYFWHEEGEDAEDSFQYTLSVVSGHDWLSLQLTSARGDLPSGSEVFSRDDEGSKRLDALIEALQTARARVFGP